ncbi:MAG: ferredoxin--NADP reductase [Magnetococcales bacterium]|nr:ferredoxin--NADP reductase [Magnetococcales bacterium]
MSSTPTYNATLQERIHVAPGLAIFRILPDEFPIPFTPGQFTILGLMRSSPRLPEAEEEEPPTRPGDRLIRRPYSISSASQQQEYLEFYISLVNSGELTPRLFMLQPGDRIFLGTKAAGLFTLEQVDPACNILMVATGTGLAPYMSMLRTHALSHDQRQITILQGARHSWDLGYRAELAALARQNNRFRYLPVVSRSDEEPPWGGLTGRLTPWLNNPSLPQLCGFPLEPDLTHVFLCGHPEMVTDASQILTDKGYTTGTRSAPGSLHLEKYW